MKEGQINPDILIIGGGIIGLSIARELHKKGARNIALVEKGRCGEEASWAAAGMLGPQAEADATGPFFDLCSASRDLYPQLAAELLDETGIDIELDRTGTLSLGFTDEECSELLRRYRRQRDAGFAVETMSAEDILKEEPLVSSLVQMGLYFPNDWQVENRKLLVALRRYADVNGIDVRENTTVDGLIVRSGRVAGVETAAGSIVAETTIVATGAWTSLIKFGDVDFPFNIQPVRGQIIAFKPERRLFWHVIYGHGGYVVPRSDGRILAGSTTEHVGFENVTTDDAAATLMRNASAIMPEISLYDVADRWSGLRPFAADGFPVLGRIGGMDGLFIATAHYRNGILLAPMTARLAAQSLLDGVESEYCAAFGPDRFRTARAGIRN